MNLLKKSVSVALSILMVSNFTFCRALEKTEKLPNNKEESSLTSYILAGAVGTVSVAALVVGAAYLFSGNNDSSNGCVNNSAYNYGNPGKHDYGNSGKNVSVNAKSGPVNIQNVPASIKAIHWKDNLCWWTSSMLYLYYHTDFKNAVLSAENRVRTNNINGNEQYSNELLVLKDLQDIFDALDGCEGNVCGITDDKVKMTEYINHLNSIRGNYVDRLEYGRFGDVVYVAIAMAMQNLGFNYYDIMPNDGIASFRCDDQSYFVGIINLPGNHFFITLTPVSEGAAGYIIGRNYKNDINSIESYSKVELENMKENWDKGINKIFSENA